MGFKQLEHKFNYQLKRPLAQLLNADLMNLIESSLSPGFIDLELATLANIEIGCRGKKIQQSKSLFKEYNHKPIHWLESARESLSILRKPSKGNYKGNLYVILRKCPPGSINEYGVYVGSTSKRIEQRFNEHKNPSKEKNLAARGMPKYAVQIMKSLSWPWRGVPSKDLIYYEYALHAALTTSIKNVWGNFKEPKFWPKNFQKKLKSLKLNYKSKS